MPRRMLRGVLRGSAESHKPRIHFVVSYSSAGKRALFIEQKAMSVVDRLLHRSSSGLDLELELR